MSTCCEHGWFSVACCPSCGIQRSTDAALREIRFRLQALEQNTIPARPAEQKLSNYGPPISAPELWANALQAGASKKPREYWLIAGAIFTDKAKAYAKSRELFEPQPAPIHVREVL